MGACSAEGVGGPAGSAGGRLGVDDRSSDSASPTSFPLPVPPPLARILGTQTFRVVVFFAFYLHKLFGWPGFAFYLHTLSGRLLSKIEKNDFKFEKFRAAHALLLNNPYSPNSEMKCQCACS